MRETACVKKIMRQATVSMKRIVLLLSQLYNLIFFKKIAVVAQGHKDGTVTRRLWVRSQLGGIIY